MTTTTLGAALDRLLLSEDVDDEQSLVNALVAATGLVDVDPETIDTDGITVRRHMCGIHVRVYIHGHASTLIYTLIHAHTSTLITRSDPHSAMRLQTLKQRLSDARESLASVDDVILASSSSTALATKQESVDDVAFARELACMGESFMLRACQTVFTVHRCPSLPFIYGLALVTDIDDLERMRKCCQLLLDVDDRVYVVTRLKSTQHFCSCININLTHTQ